MSSREKFLALMLKELGLGYDITDLENIEGRKFFQKVTYLVQEEIDTVTVNAVSLNYHYNLYLHGPYSPELAESGFNILENKDDYISYQLSHKLKEKYSPRIKAVAEFIRTARDKLKKEIVDILELFTTTHFLFSKSYSYLADYQERKDEAGKRCNKLKPQFPLQLCEEALTMMFPDPE